MSKRVLVRGQGKPRYVITYYGTGMTAQHKYIDDPAEAVAEAERMFNDPYAGFRSLELRQDILSTKYEF